MKELKDYLRLYLWCEVMIEKKWKCKLVGYERGYPVVENLGFPTWARFETVRVKDFALIKPILRRLSDMSEEEAIELVGLRAWKQYGNHPHDRKYETYKNGFGQIVVSWGDGFREKNVPESKDVFDPEEFRYLLSKHFDLFGLIESGLAIDKQTL